MLMSSKAGLVQGAHGLGDAPDQGVAALNRQIGKYGAGTDALQAVNADVVNRKTDGTACAQTGESASQRRVSKRRDMGRVIRNILRSGC